MPKYVIEAECTVPTYVRYAVDAETDREALIIGAKVADDVNGDNVWIDPNRDYESSSRITVTVIPSEEEDPDGLPCYEAPARPCDVGGASAAPAIRHLGHDLVREMTAVIQAYAQEHSTDVDLYGELIDWRDRLQVSL